MTGNSPTTQQVLGTTAAGGFLASLFANSTNAFFTIIVICAIIAALAILVIRLVRWYLSRKNK